MVPLPKPNGKQLEVTSYGERNYPGPNPNANNMRGQVYEHYNGAGLQVARSGYNYKGMTIETMQQLIQSKTATDVDWLSDVNMELEFYFSSAVTDAFGRPVATLDAGGNETRYAYDAFKVSSKGSRSAINAPTNP